MFIIGPKGAGKTLHGRYLAERLGIFHIDFKERLQELIIGKTKKRVGCDSEDEDDNTSVNPTGTEDDKSTLFNFSSLLVVLVCPLHL